MYIERVVGVAVVQRGQARPQPRPHDDLALGVVDPEPRADHLDERLVQADRAVRAAVALEPGHVGAEVLAQLAEEARLADPGLADQEERLSAPGEQVVRGSAQVRGLGLPADERRLRVVAAGRLAAQDAPGRHRCRPPLQRELAHRLEHEARHQPLGRRLAGHDRPRERPPPGAGPRRSSCRRAPPPAAGRRPTTPTAARPPLIPMRTLNSSMSQAWRTSRPYAPTIAAPRAPPRRRGRRRPRGRSGRRSRRTPRRPCRPAPSRRTPRRRGSSASRTRRRAPSPRRGSCARPGRWSRRCPRRARSPAEARHPRRTPPGSIESDGCDTQWLR